MKFELFECDIENKEKIVNLMQLYTYELSFYEDETTNFTMLENGLFSMSRYLDLYWEEENRHPYILKCEDKLAGFALVRLNEEGIYEIGEFFVLNKYRKQGAGKFMVNEVFKMFKGKWEICTLLKNKNAQEFWRKIVREVSNNTYEENLNQDSSRYAFYFEN